MSYTPTPLEHELLRGNLGYFDAQLTPAMDAYLDKLIVKAHRDLARLRIPIDGTDVDDASLSAMYAAWLYRKRETGEGKPRMLKEEIHDRQVDRVTRGGGA